MAVSSNVIRVQSGRERDSCGFLTKALQVKTRPPTIHIFLPLSIFLLPPSLSPSFFSHRQTHKRRERDETRKESGKKGQDLPLNCGISGTHTAQKRGESHHSGRYQDKELQGVQRRARNGQVRLCSTPASFALLLVVQIKAKPVPWYVVCLHIRMPSLSSLVCVFVGGCCSCDIFLCCYISQCITSQAA
jgi:hypothetical protein